MCSAAIRRLYGSAKPAHTAGMLMATLRLKDIQYVLTNGL
jgi:hypothetical protein